MISVMQMMNQGPNNRSTPASRPARTRAPYLPPLSPVAPPLVPHGPAPHANVIAQILMVGLFSGFNLNPGATRSLPTGAFWPQPQPQQTSDAQSERSNSEASPPIVPTSTAVNHMPHNYAPGYPEWQAAQKAFAAAQSVNGAAAGAKFPPGPSGRFCSYNCEKKEKM
ncbi:hypothetical protein ANCCAN_23048 [Ancylostoma caninum]|uniref:Uncharacterized protein n=1 Tax=Ancylostoma caninum TaxID=29170 RepID=A0A368FI11_ANCCA|nr:hypothetical protein ANCCAN_23048 [Ancylostoma caninum]